MMAILRMLFMKSGKGYSSNHSSAHNSVKYCFGLPRPCCGFDYFQFPRNSDAYYFISAVADRKYVDGISIKNFSICAYNVIRVGVMRKAWGVSRDVVHKSIPISPS